MNHFTHFIVWLLTKCTRSICSGPIRFNSFYRDKLKYEPIFWSFITVFFGIAILFLTATMGSFIEDGKAYITDAGLYAVMVEAVLIVGYYLYTLVAIQYAKYCSELDDTVRRLKAQEQNW